MAVGWGLGPLYENYLRTRFWAILGMLEVKVLKDTKKHNWGRFHFACNPIFFIVFLMTFLRDVCSASTKVEYQVEPTLIEFDVPAFDKYSDQSYFFSSKSTLKKKTEFEERIQKERSRSLIKEKVIVGDIFLQEYKNFKEFRYAGWISERYARYYQVDPMRFLGPAKKVVYAVLLDPFFNTFLEHATAGISITPTGVVERVLDGASLFTNFATKTIYFDLLHLFYDSEYLIAGLANELQHLSTITVNELCFNARLAESDSEFKIKQYRNPFNGAKQERIYKEHVNLALRQLIEHVDIKSYLESSRAFSIYFKALIGYDLEICRELLEKSPLVETGEVSRDYRNAYTETLPLDEQWFEFDSSIASIYFLLASDDQLYLKPWVDYHADLYQLCIASNANSLNS